LKGIAGQEDSVKPFAGHFVQRAGLGSASNAQRAVDSLLSAMSSTEIMVRSSLPIDFSAYGSKWCNGHDRTNFDGATQFALPILVILGSCHAKQK
jgi:hypothetical protein